MNNKIKKIIPLWLAIKLTNLRNAIDYHNPFCQKKIILGRCACLGNELLRIWLKKHKKYLVINQQKTRVDLFLDCINGAPRPKAGVIKKYFRLKRSDLEEIVKQQEKLPWLKNKRPIEFLVMDSFTELTNKKFTHKKEGWSFCCYWSDLNHSEDFDREFSSHGMLPLENLEKTYRAFFTWLETSFPCKEVFFIHYPSLFDTRSEYKERGAAILQTMQKISADKPYIKNFFLNDGEITEKIKTDPFPYHYNKEVYQKLSEKFNKH
jgi:hypothetical protein